MEQIPTDHSLFSDVVYSRNVIEFATVANEFCAFTESAGELGRKDFGGIVWDEIIAFWIVLILIMPTNIWMQAFAFILFRFFDAVKPGPIGMIDRHFKNNESKSNAVSSIPQILWRGFGIMVDDLAAAFFTLLIIALVQVFIR